jgi:FdhD protein
MDAVVTRAVRRYPGSRSAEDRLVVEAPLELRLGGTPLAVLMRTPGWEVDLAYGFAITEGMIVHPRELAGVRWLEGGDRLELTPAPGVTIDPEQFRRNAYTTSSCGVCGKASIDAVRVASPPLPAGPSMSAELVMALPDLLLQAQPTFGATGGLHGAALFTSSGELVGAAEDIGRHNAVDKVIGRQARTAWPPEELILMVSGRISFEIAQKAAVAGLPAVVGVSAASSLAVDLAEELGMTVIGFVREGGFVTYADRARITGP